MTTMLDTACRRPAGTPLRLLRSAAIALLLCSAAPFAPAAETVLLDDDFNAENMGAGRAEYSGFANFSVANVDLLAPGYFGQLCNLAGGSTACVDMEGGGNGAMTTKTAYAVTPGLVTMRFDLAGDQRGRSGNGVTVSLFSSTNDNDVFFRESFSLASDADFTTFTRSVVVPFAASVRLSFLSTGPSDSMGMLLDNVKLSAGPVAPVPEPSTVLMFCTGLAGCGFVARRRARSSAG